MEKQQLFGDVPRLLAHPIYGEVPIFYIAYVFSYPSPFFDQCSLLSYSSI
jgi:hypothetical protein